MNNNQNNVASFEEKKVTVMTEQQSREFFPDLSDQSEESTSTVPYGAVFKQQMKMSIPMIGVTIADTLNGFATGIILGQISDDALAAGSIIGSANLILSIALMAPLHSSSILIREAKGSNKLIDIPLIWRQSLLIGSALSVPPIFIMKFGMTPLLSSLGQREEIIKIVQDYFDAYIWAIFPSTLASCYEEFALGIDATKLVMLMRLLELGILSGVGYGLAFGKFGNSEMKVTGLSYAFCVQAIISSLLYTFLISKKTNLKDYHLFSQLFAFNSDKLRKMWSMGWPMGLSALNELSAEFVVTLFAGKISDMSLAVREISSTYASILLEPTFAFARGTSLLVGEKIGEKRLNDAYRFGNMGITLGLAVGITGLTIFCGIPRTLTATFVDVDDDTNKTLVNMMKPVLALTATIQLVDSVRNIGFGALSGLPDTLVPTVITTFSTWGISVPLAYALGDSLGFGMNGLLIGQGVGMAIGSLALYIRWVKECQKSEKYLPVVTTAKNNTQPDTQPATQPKTSLFGSIKNYSVNIFKRENTIDNNPYKLLQSPTQNIQNAPGTYTL